MQFHFFSLDCPFVVGSNLLRSALESFLKAASIRETEKLRTTIIRETERLRIKIPFLTARGGGKDEGTNHKHCILQAHTQR
jgi:hypothetical protein